MTDIQTMGVINITPNSFSDGNLYNSFDLLRKKLQNFPKSIIWDVGAESTAPFNDPIGIEEERKRLELSFDLLDEFRPQKISLDTYRGECAFWYFKELRRLGFKDDQFIWNDVSGQWDESVLDFLDLFSDSTYIYSHNLAPMRSLTSNHMDYVREEDIISGLKKFFSKNKLDPKNIWLDPCFGFSKSFEQNCQLLHNFSEVFDHFSDFTWVIGISKKSFLRRFLEEISPCDLDKEEKLNKSEWLHLLFVRKFIEDWRLSANAKPLVFRVHDPLLISVAQSNLADLK